MDSITDSQATVVKPPSPTLLWDLLSRMPDPILVKDRQHRWFFVNDALCELIGYRCDDLLGKTDGEVFSQEDPLRGWERDEHLFTTGMATVEEDVFTHACGDRITVSASRYLCHDEHSQPFLVSMLRVISTQQVSTQHQIEAELQESRQLLQIVIDNIPQIIFWKDRHSVYLGCNQNYARNVGLNSPDQIVGKTDYDLYPDRAEADRYRTRDRQIMESDTPEYGIVVSKTWIDGQKTWAELNKIPLHDASGQVIGIVGTYEDITDRQQAEETLRQSEATNRALLEAIPDLLIRMGADGTYLGIAFEGSFKPAAIEAKIGKNIYDLMPRHIAQERMYYTAQALETGKLQIYDQELVIDGQLVYEEVRIVPCGTDEVLVMLRDVTDRKQAEIALQQLNEELEQKVEERTHQLTQAIAQLEQEICDRKQAKVQLQEQEEFLRSIYEGIEHQIFVVNVSEQGEFCYEGWNRFTEDKIGIRSEDAIGKSPEEIFGPVEGAEVRRRYAACLEKGETISYEECLTFQGQPFWFITTLNPLKYQNGTIYRIVGTTFNITDRKRTEVALQQSEMQLRHQTQELEETLRQLQTTQMQLVQSEKMSSLGQLVAGVAHEINNPVNFIYGNLKHADRYTQDVLELLHLYQQHYPTPNSTIQAAVEAIDLDFLMEDLPKLLRSMKVGADRIQKIVASLRTFSRMDEAEMKAVNLHDCLDSTLMILQSQLKATPDRVKIEVIQDYDELPLVECYAGQLNQVFMNILSNAIDALDEAIAIQIDHSPSITIRTRMVGRNQVVIQIADNGSGIPEDKKARIFDPFFTTKPIGKGTGMGLSISYQIVTEKHGGRLWCNSTVGQGTEFVIEIPVRQSPAFK